MTDEAPDPSREELQFDSAEPAGERPAGPVCALCQKPITTYYFEAAGKVVCSSCKNQVLASNVSGVAAGTFLRAAFFGFFGALAGAGVYYAVLATTGYEVGLIAILVGFMVGYAVRMGAGGRGGRRYQILALGLTYLAIGGTYVPVAMRQMGRNQGATADSTRAEGDTSEAAPATETASAVMGTEAADTSAAAPSLAGLAIGLAALAALAAAMPVLVVIFGFPQSLISALIIGFALHQAWRMNGRLKVTFTGPFKVGAAPGAAGAAGGGGAVGT